MCVGGGSQNLILHFRGGPSFFLLYYRGRAKKFQLNTHRDSSGPPPLLKNEWSLMCFICKMIFFIIQVQLEG